MLNCVFGCREALLVALILAVILFGIGYSSLPAVSSGGSEFSSNRLIFPIATVIPIQNPTTPYQNPTTPYQSQPQQQQQPSTTPLNTTSMATSAQQALPTLVVVTRLNNTGRGDVTNATNFSLVVANAYSNPDGYTYSYHFMRGSQIGVTLNLEPGIFAVYEPTNNGSKVNSIQSIGHSYSTTYSGDCSNVKSTMLSVAGSSAVYGYGVIRPGESKTCIVTNSLH